MTISHLPIKVEADAHEVVRVWYGDRLIVFAREEADELRRGLNREMGDDTDTAMIREAHRLLSVVEEQLTKTAKIVGDAAGRLR